MAETALVGDARSVSGHAAYSMRGIDDRWVVIQKNTFKNWVNEQLKESGHSLNSLETDLCDGIRLCALVEGLQKKKIGKVVKKPINHHQYLENVTLALRAMINDEIKLVNIGSEDIVNGNMKLILGMIWRLILRYQIGKASKVPPKKLMLSWLQAVIPEMNITNFSTDWNDGVALHALLEYCKPGTCPNWKNLSRLNGLENCREAMELGKQHFDIPLVVTPENFSNPDLDELSGMTYLSYYMKMDSPGYLATLRWAQSQIPQKKVKNFQNDWNDGTALTDLVNSLGGTISLVPKGKLTTIQECMDVAKRMGVEPVISPQEMASLDVDHLGVMAYVAWFQNLARKMSPKHQPVVYNRETVQNKIPLSKQIIFNQITRESLPGNNTTLTLETLDQNVRSDDVTIEVIGPTTKPTATLTWHGTQGHGQFKPQEGGIHKVYVYNKGELVDGCPHEIYVKGESKTPQQLLHLLSMFKDCHVGTTQVIRLKIENQ